MNIFEVTYISLQGKKKIKDIESYLEYTAKLRFQISTKHKSIESIKQVY